MSKRATTQGDNIAKRRKPAQKSRKECYKINRTDYRQFSINSCGYQRKALAYNNNLLLIYCDVNDHVQLFQIYTLEGFFVTSYENVVKIGRTKISDLRFTNDFILASFQNLCLIRISDYNIKQRLASSYSFRFPLDSDKYGNFYAIEPFNSEYKIGIYNFDFEFLQLFNNDLHDYGCPLSLCIKEDTMFVVTRFKDNSLTLFKVDLINGKIMNVKKLNHRLLPKPIYLFVDDMYNVFISCVCTTHICIYYASGRIRYFITNKLERDYQESEGIAYVANCNSIFVLKSPHFKMYSLAL